MNLHFGDIRQNDSNNGEAEASDVLPGKEAPLYPREMF
jgi:hypothetical protein